MKTVYCRFKINNLSHYELLYVGQPIDTHTAFTRYHGFLSDRASPTLSLRGYTARQSSASRIATSRHQFPLCNASTISDDQRTPNNNIYTFYFILHTLHIVNYNLCNNYRFAERENCISFNLMYCNRVYSLQWYTQLAFQMQKHLVFVIREHSTPYCIQLTPSQDSQLN